MGTGTAVVLVMALIIVGALIYIKIRKEKEVADSEYQERKEKREEKLGLQDTVQEVLVKDDAVLLEEFELYVQLLAVYAEEHVSKTDQLISSNRLSLLVKDFSSRYSNMMGKGIPVAEKPYHRIKQVLKLKGLMVQPK